FFSINSQFVNAAQAFICLSPEREDIAQARVSKLLSKSPVCFSPERENIAQATLVQVLHLNKILKLKEMDDKRFSLFARQEIHVNLGAAIIVIRQEAWRDCLVERNPETDSNRGTGQQLILLLAVVKDICTPGCFPTRNLAFGFVAVALWISVDGSLD
ncbi:hypothetical protein Lal_00014097, partial [Lupinus albus]